MPDSFKYWKRNSGTATEEPTGSFSFWRARAGATYENPIQEQHPEVERLKLQSFGNPQSIARHLKEQGFKVAQSSKGQLAVKKDYDEEWRVMDPLDLDAGDWKDILGDAFVIGSQVFGGIAAATAGLATGPGAIALGAAGAAGSGAAAETARQYAGRLFGIRPTMGEVARDAGIEAATGAAGEVLGPLAGKVVGMGVKGIKGAVKPITRRIGRLAGAAEELSEKQIAQETARVTKRLAGQGFHGEALERAVKEEVKSIKAQHRIPSSEIDKLAERRVREAVDEGPIETVYRKRDGSARRMRMQGQPDTPAPSPEDIQIGYSDIPTETRYKQTGPTGKILVPSGEAPPVNPPKILRPDDFPTLPKQKAPPPDYVPNYPKAVDRPGIRDEAIVKGVGHYVQEGGERRWQVYTRDELERMPRSQIEHLIGQTQKGYVKGEGGGRVLGEGQMRVIDPEAMGPGFKTIYPTSVRAFRGEGGERVMTRAPTGRMKLGAGLERFGSAMYEGAPSQGLLGTMGTVAAAGGLFTGNPLGGLAFGAGLWATRSMMRGGGRAVQKLGMRLMRDTSGSLMRRIAMSARVPEKIRMAAESALQALSNEGQTKYKAAVYAMLNDPEIRRWFSENGSEGQ